MYYIIANMLSGKGAGKKCLETAEKYLTENNLPFQTEYIDGHGSGRALAQKFCAMAKEAGASTDSGAFHTVIAIGGDGTFHEVLNGMDFSAARLGLVPAGRGNDYAVGAKISFDPKIAMQAIVHGKPVDRDYIQVGERRCLNVCGTGLDVEVLKLTEENKNTYIFSLSKLLLNYKPYTVQVERDGMTQEYQCVMAAFCNGSQFGGGIKLCPPAKIADGKMDLMIVKQPKGPVLMAMPVFVAGQHIGRPWAEHIVCDKAKITVMNSGNIEIDGEIYNDSVLDGQIVPGGFKTFE
ncbi:MAG: hypothetical protein J5700_07775 [Treponema sp.]|nr:hypothetical protein [Treponema sp.]